jgi:hypothetical protein
MPEVTKIEREEIVVPVLDLPNREESKSILRTGKTTEGFPVSEESRKDLRKATIMDLKAFGREVNKANTVLDAKINDMFDSFDLAIRDQTWNFATFLSFLAQQGILKEGALQEYEIFKEGAEQELAKASEFLLKKQEEAKEKSETDAIVNAAPVSDTPPNPAPSDVSQTPTETV